MARVNRIWPQKKLRDFYYLLRFVEAFSLFCGMAIRNAAQYEKAVVSEAKLQVAFEVMNYQAAASGVEANR